MRKELSEAHSELSAEDKRLDQKLLESVAILDTKFSERLSLVDTNLGDCRTNAEEHALTVQSLVANVDTKHSGARGTGR